MNDLPSLDEFSESDRVIKVGLKNIEPGSEINNAEDFEFPPGFNIDDYIVIASPLDNLGSENFDRTPTEGRAVGRFLGNITDKFGHFYILIKGVGGRIKHDLRLKKGSKSEEVQPYQSVKSKRKFPVRFVPNRPVRGVDGVYGLSFKDSTEHDNEGSNELASAGLRTRRLIFSGDYGQKVMFSTHEGVLKRNEIALMKGINPAIEIWAMRCRYRLRDIKKYSLVDKYNYEYLYELEKVWDEDDFGRTFLSDPYEVRVKKVVKFDDKEKDKIKQDFIEVLQFILIRIQHDDDERFSELYLKFKDSKFEDIEDIKSFFGKYINIFGEILGEQVGIMYSKGAFTSNKMLNDQNVTLVAEIVDHDVTFFSPENMDDGNKVIEQIKQTYDSFCYLLIQLTFLGLIPDDFDYRKAIDTYSEGLSHILVDRGLLRRFSDSIQLYNEENPQKLSEEYNPIIDLRSLIERNKGINEDNKVKFYENKINKLKERLAWDQISKKWVNGTDILGSGRYFYLMSRFKSFSANIPIDFEKKAEEKAA